MIPSENAASNPYRSSWIPGQKETAGSIVLHASKVSIQVKPRSPGRSPAKFLPKGNIGHPNEACTRPVVHLEVEQRRGDPGQPGLLKPGPGAIVDVVQVPSSRAPPIALPPDAAANAAVSITVLPAGACMANGGPAPALLAVSQPGAKRGASAGRQHAGVASSIHAAGPSTASHKHGRSAWGIQSGGGAAPAALVPTRQHVPATAASMAPATTASVSVGAARGVTGPPPSVIGLSDQRSAAAMPPQTNKGGGAALLAELLGQHIVAGVQPPPTVAANANTKALNAMSGYSGQPGFLIPGKTALTSRPVVTAADNADAAFRESRSLLWSWDQDLAATVALKGMPDSEEEARRARRRHRKRVARIVVDHWKQFSQEGLRVVAARRHLRRRLLTAAWVAWQAEAASTRSRMRLAAIYDLKRSFLALGRCVKAWGAVVKRLAQLRAVQERITVGRLLRQSRACLRAWRGRCYYAAEKQRRRLQAWFYYCFSTLTRVLRRWHEWAAQRRSKARQAAWAVGQHLKRLGHKALTACRQRVALQKWKFTAGEHANWFRRHWALRGALRAWSDAMAMHRTAREAASSALMAAVARLEAQKAATAFMEWMVFAAERRRRHKRERYGMAYMRRWWQLMVMWAWRQRVVRSRHLRICGRHLQRVGRRVRLGLCWSRWCLVVEVLQGQRNAELRAAVLSRASWAAWRAAVEHRAAKRELLRIATQRVARVVARAALAAWRNRTAIWQVKAARCAHAIASHRRRALRRLLEGWRREAGRLSAKAAATQAAQWHLRRKLLGRAVRVWRRYAWRKCIKAVAAEHYLRRLLHCALVKWLRHARYKAQKEMDRRQAVRHRYLTLLHSGLHAFQSAVARRLAKQKDWADLDRLHSLHVERAVMRAWCHEFLPIARVERAVARRAEKQRNSVLLRHALAGWMQQAARLAAKHAQLRAAVGFAALQLLRRMFYRWEAAAALMEDRRAAKAVRLTRLVATLATTSARRLLAAWREVHQDMIMKRFQVCRAQASWRDRILRRAMTRWALYLASRRVAGLRNARALCAYRARALRTAFDGLFQHTARRRAKRRLAAVASEHRRMGLLRRSITALVWYARYRVAKVRGYITARTLYVRRLQREGAAAWLQAGTERRQQRIELLAAQQARNLVQELARVEPFARRWLNVVRCKWRHAFWSQPMDATAAASYTVAATAHGLGLPKLPSSLSAGLTGKLTAPIQQKAKVSTKGAMQTHNPRRQRGWVGLQHDRVAAMTDMVSTRLPGPVCFDSQMSSRLPDKAIRPLASQAIGIDFAVLGTTGAAAWITAAENCDIGLAAPNLGRSCEGEGGRQGLHVAAPSRQPILCATPSSVGAAPFRTTAVSTATDVATNPSPIPTAAAADAAASSSTSGQRFTGSPQTAFAWQPKSNCSSVFGARHGAHLRGQAALSSGPSTTGADGASGMIQCPIGASRNRPSPRCPGFLLHRPTTVCGPAGASTRVPYFGPVSSAAPARNAVHPDLLTGSSCQESVAGGYSSRCLDSAATIIATTPPVSPSTSMGITIHRPGLRPPDVFRLPTRGEGGWVDEDITGGDAGGRIEDAGTWGSALSQRATVQPASLEHTHRH
ncbi:hypothetical protein VaNZ11_016013 [Volvox africanus]|uniref:Sfi1 spindle body domain-containing protein n=1 Tax=Volvox africanus TaxID=51714 RepID=A0ABQ5SNW7_9CHLO|nr:hypothetical protein VaNZ11_016013 [Volvox africanus]